MSSGGQSGGFPWNSVIFLLIICVIGYTLIQGLVLREVSFRDIINLKFYKPGKTESNQGDQSKTSQDPLILPSASDSPKKRILTSNNIFSSRTYEATSDELLNAYEDDSQEADFTLNYRYKKRLTRVIGKYKDIENSSPILMTLSRDDIEQDGTVSCYIPKEQEQQISELFPELSQGQAVVVEGRLTSGSSYNIRLEKCSFIKLVR